MFCGGATVWTPIRKFASPTDRWGWSESVVSAIWGSNSLDPGGAASRPSRAGIRSGRKPSNLVLTTWASDRMWKRSRLGQGRSIF